MHKNLLTHEHVHVEVFNCCNAEQIIGQAGLETHEQLIESKVSPLLIQFYAVIEQSC
jgi:hypothetical protein